MVAKVVARDPGPDAQAIPTLLLSATVNVGPGVYGGVRSIQRLRTAGGLAPDAASCTQPDQVARVPYRAVYYFDVTRG